MTEPTKLTVKPEQVRVGDELMVNCVRRTVMHSEHILANREYKFEVHGGGVVFFPDFYTLEVFRSESMVMQDTLNAMCLWEALIEGLHTGTASWVDFANNFIDENGTPELREKVLDWSDVCSRVATRLANGGECIQPYDFEFCPRFLKHAIDWERMVVEPKAFEIMKALYARFGSLAEPKRYTAQEWIAFMETHLGRNK